MQPEDILYHWENLAALDPDQLVSDLNLTTEELLDAFTERAALFIEKEFG